MDSIVTKTKKNLNIKMDKMTLIDGCVKLITENGRPLTILEDQGFRMIIDPIIEAIGQGNIFKVYVVFGSPKTLGFFFIDIMLLF